MLETKKGVSSTKDIPTNILFQQKMGKEKQRT
jgi:hypothetical protein